MSHTSIHKPKFVAEMQAKLLAEKASLEQELAALGKGKGLDKHAAFPDYGRNDEENATEVADYQASESAAETLEERLIGVTAALERIHEGTYGVTAEGESIPEDRLRANPAATTIIKKE